ncbi:transcription factor LHW [Iris pallida]|uniref:Transcription factor LHW n=1 Tax=Iris pallida TaxID=29817 RepID=A0AAX6E9H6_IRIPA|nr:transcription factor LHW [Iris pallida]
MGALLKEALRSLSVEIGWTYAVFWRSAGSGDHIRHLIWEDGHCEFASCGRATIRSESMDLLINESGALRSNSNSGGGGGGFVEVYKSMAAQVHIVGDGVVGRAAFTGNHEWILGDMLNDGGSIMKNLAGIIDQLLAGIKTIAIIPVLPHGVVQLGSNQMVMENIRFISHVKGLFEQLGCQQGALLSDMTKNSSNENIHLHTSSGMQSSLSQFGVGTNTNDSSFPGGNNGNYQHFKYPISRALNQPSCASSTEFYSKTVVNAPTLPLVEENVSSTMTSASSFSRPVHHVVKPFFHLNSRHESGEQPQVMFSNPDIGLIKSELPYDPVSGIQYHPSVVLPSGRSAFLKEQFFSMSNIRSRELANNNEPNLNNSNNIEFHSHVSAALSSVQVSDTVSTFGRSELLNNIEDPRVSNSFSNVTGSIRQFVDSSSLEAPVVLKEVIHSPFKQMISRESEPSCPASVSKESHISSFAEKQEKSGMFHVSESSSTIFGKHTSCIRSLHANPQDGPVQENSVCVENSTCRSPNRNNDKCNEILEFLHTLDEKTSRSSLQSSSGNDLFDLLRLDHNKYGYRRSSLDDVIVYGTDSNAHELSTDVSTCVTEIDVPSIFNVSDNEICRSGTVAETASDHLLDAVVSRINPGAKLDTYDNVSCKTSQTQICSSSHYPTSPTYCWVPPSKHMHGETFLLPPVHVKSEPTASSSGKSSCSMERNDGCFSQRNGGYNSQINLWIENGQNLNCDNPSAAHCKRIGEVGKPNRKRSRPGENPRPRPKDRQMIQDHVKELREIVPNGAKCSIDALLEKTIKHMLFLRSVTKHADKLKEAGVPKIISKDGGLLLKDNFEGGATWAYEVGSQSMICPIVVEDLSPPRQMLVEMLCEEQGLFLEIADLVRSLGLTILKGVLETRKDKVWARFAVEASTDVTRMEIFLSLMRLLEPSAGSSKAPEFVHI